MKGLILVLLVTVSLHSKSQCTKCTTLVDALKNPEAVITLKINGSVSGNKLDSLPGSIGLLVNAEVLYISDHNIKAIPKEIGSLKKLKELSFAGCLLENLPDEIFTLSNLKEVILFDNSFSEETKRAIESKFEKLLPKTKVLL